MRKVFLEDLPRRGKTNQINWIKSVGECVEFVYEDVTGTITISNYNTFDKQLLISYNDKHYNISITNFASCKLGKILNKVTCDFKVDVGQHINNLAITDKKYQMVECSPDRLGRIYHTQRKWYKYTCNKCGWTEGWIEENNLLIGNGCSCCYGRTAVLGINTIWDTDRWMCDLGVSEEDAKKYTRSSNKKITCICPHCNHRFLKTPNNICSKKSISCSNCGDGFSYPEKFMCNALRQLNVQFQSQYSPKYLKNNIGQKRSDFYIPSLNLVIEADGGIGHKGGRIYNKDSKPIDELIKIDIWKDEQHSLHGIETIRINCFNSDSEYIKNNILKSKLSSIFDLNKVDWNVCEKYATTSNIIKEVSLCWDNRESWQTTKYFANLFGIGNSTVRNYLNKGNKLGFCVYNGKDELKKSSSNIGRSKGIRLEVFKDNVSVGIFDSATELEKISENVFGTKLLQSCISVVCNGKRRQYKGYTFKYVENNNEELQG